MAEWRKTGDWRSHALKDARGIPIKAGDKIVRPITSSGRSTNLEFATVREIKDGRIYLDTSKVPIQFPGRMLIINKLYDGEEDNKEA